MKSLIHKGTGIILKTNWQNFFNSCPRITTPLKRKVTTNHQKRTTIVYVLLDIIQILLVNKWVVFEVLKNNQIKRTQVIVKQ